MTETVGSTATPERGRPESDDKRSAPPRRKRSRKSERKGFFARAARFYRQIISELRKVVWPTRNELVTYTSVVIVFVVIIMAVVYGLDYGFSKLSFLVFG
ncbi:preprotein translocase subunit SecE [Phaeacidiphilus oryzae]|uniref:preprotein translocase subunit SecE n=1 Tax=Phaeacidiphilus oryzae TaxID=348818 RepID=UPI0005661727|nr:preprotein translocase subunit SecE [Phaeacidiphilus oryzae]